MRLLQRLTFNTVGSLNVVLTSNPAVTQSGSWVTSQISDVGTNQEIRAQSQSQFQQGIRHRFVKTA